MAVLQFLEGAKSAGWTAEWARASYRSNGSNGSTDRTINRTTKGAMRMGSMGVSVSVADMDVGGFVVVGLGMVVRRWLVVIWRRFVMVRRGRRGRFMMVRRGFRMVGFRVVWLMVVRHIGLVVRLGMVIGSGVVVGGFGVTIGGFRMVVGFWVIWSIHGFMVVRWWLVVVRHVVKRTRMVRWGRGWFVMWRRMMGQWMVQGSLAVRPGVMEVGSGERDGRVRRALAMDLAEEAEVSLGLGQQARGQNGSERGRLPQHHVVYLPLS